MESRKLEITLHSANGLADVKYFGTMDPFAVVWIAGDGMESKPLKTTVATKAASSPVWDCHMEFDVSPLLNTHILFCEIKHNGKVKDRKIGRVQVPFTELMAGDASGERARYPVMTMSGDVKGEIVLSHKFSEMTVKSDDKDDTPTKKVDGKKKCGIVKRIAQNFVTEVASELISSAVFSAIDEANDDDDDDDDHEDEDEDEH